MKCRGRPEPQAVAIRLVGNDNFLFYPSDGDPPAMGSSNVFLGGTSCDNFIFHPGLGGDTGSFNPPAETTEFGQFCCRGTLVVAN